MPDENYYLTSEEKLWIEKLRGKINLVLRTNFWELLGAINCRLDNENIMCKLAIG